MTPASSSSEASYEATLEELAARRPCLAAALRRAQQQRTHRAASLLHGARFKGLEALLRHLDELARAFEADPALSRLAFLVTRSAADFEAATEATLSGYLAVATDAMRDVMEIENLLLNFAVSPAHINEWLAATPATMQSRFRPAKIRQRLHAAQEGRYATTAESVDYQAHSAALHVSPHRHPSPPRASPLTRDGKATLASGRSSSMPGGSCSPSDAWPARSTQIRHLTCLRSRTSLTCKTRGGAPKRCRRSTSRCSKPPRRQTPGTETRLDLST
jgi:hypothetical protein